MSVRRIAAADRRGRLMIRWQSFSIILVSVVLAATTPAVLASEPGSSAAGAVSLSITLCTFLPKHFSGGTLRYAIDGPNGVAAHKSLTWNSNDRNALRWAARVPPGVYEYSAQGLVKPDALPCNAEGYVAVLPGSLRRIDGLMHAGIGDPTVPLYIYGTVPNDVAVTVVHFDNRPDCGSNLSGLQLHTIDTERDSVGFYAADSSLSGTAQGENSAFGILIRRPNENERILRVVASYPSKTIAIPPTSLRVDITNDLMRDLYKSSADTVYCRK